MKVKDYILAFLVIFLAIISWRISDIYLNRYHVSYLDKDGEAWVHDRKLEKVYLCDLEIRYT